MENELRSSLDIDFMDILYEDDSVSIVDVLVLHEGINRNDCDISHDVILAALPTLANKPLWAIPNCTYMKPYSDDFVEHARNKEDEKNIVIFGVFTESGVKNYSFVEINNKTYLKVQAVLFKKYSPIAINIIKNRDGNCKISIEILAKGKMIDGIFKIEEMIFEAAVALGADIPEGIEGSSMDVVRFSLDETIKDFNDRYFRFSVEDKYKTPQKVKDNAKLGLELRKEYGRGGTSVGANTAKQITSNDYLSYEKVKKISQYFPRHANDNLDEKNPPSNGYIAWLLWGGKEAWNWSKGIVDRKEGETVENSLIFIAKDKIGTKEAIKINKGKDSVSELAWGDEDKSSLKKDCLMASNWKKLCESVFLKLEDGWEDGKESSLGYPVMEKKGEAVVYNRAGLASAKAYAEKNNETEVLSKLKKIYEHLSIPWGSELKNMKEGEKLEENEVKPIENAEEIVEDVTPVENSLTPQEEEVKEVENAVVEDWEGKYSEMEQKYNAAVSELEECKNKLMTYERKEEEEKMSSYIQKYSHRLSKEDVKKFSENIENSKFEELKHSVDERVLEYAERKEDIKAEEINNSYQTSTSNFGAVDPVVFETNKNKPNDLDSITKKSGVKIKTN